MQEWPQQDRLLFNWWFEVDDYFYFYFPGGDIFIHAKCNERGKLFELAQLILSQLPPNSVDRCEDIYGWVYKGGRDLSGFIDGKILFWFAPHNSVNSTRVSVTRTS